MDRLLDSVGLITNEISNGVVIADAQEEGFPIVMANHRFRTLTGYGDEEVLGRSCAFLQGNVTQKTTVQKISNALRKGERCHVVIHNYKKSGEMFLNELKLIPFKENGTTRFYIGILHDVTAIFVAKALYQRKSLTSMPASVYSLVEKSLEIPKIAGSLNLLSDFGLAVVDEQDVIVFGTEPLAELTGMSCDELVGQPLSAILESTTLPTLTSVPQGLSTGWRPASLVSRESSRHPVMASTTRAPNAANSTLGVVLMRLPSRN
ncbi:MAG: PAS domain-containing protein [Acidobacteriota bacterium]